MIARTVNRTVEQLQAELTAATRRLFHARLNRDDGRARQVTLEREYKDAKGLVDGLRMEVDRAERERARRGAA
jgi:hypothetical protein